MTPSLDKGFTWPESLKDEVYRLAGEYIIDAKEAGVDYRQMEKERVLKWIYDMDSQRFTLLKHFISNKQCDYIFTVITGCDRIPHLFYHYFDEQHRRYDPDSRYKNALHDYYIWIDKQIGEVWDSLDGETVLFVHSAHGVQRLNGLINLNEWLIQEGYMVLHEYPSKPAPLVELSVPDI
ncbi:MAG: alkaline phosphatase family protein [Deltaproteobacteria bacterium]|nr:alkaline phosphatase family protein [Deltaproteobacteria bacterium]